MTSTIGIPIKLLNEAQVRHATPTRDLAKTASIGPCGHTRDLVWASLPWEADRRYAPRRAACLLRSCSAARETWRTISLTTALHAVEDSMNCQMRDITVTARDGRVSHLDQVYIRGSHVRFFIVPDMLRYVPCLYIFNEHSRRPHCRRKW